MIKHDRKNIHCYVYPNAYIYADITKYEDGDLMEVARITFNDGEIKTRKNSILPDDLLQELKQQQQKIYNHEKIEISSSGQYIIAGCDIK